MIEEELARLEHWAVVTEARVEGVAVLTLTQEIRRCWKIMHEPDLHDEFDSVGCDLCGDTMIIATADPRSWCRWCHKNSEEMQDVTD